jgi:formate hydrogenlyase subunit 4
VRCGNETCEWKQSCRVLAASVHLVALVDFTSLLFRSFPLVLRLCLYQMMQISTMGVLNFDIAANTLMVDLGVG